MLFLRGLGFDHGKRYAGELPAVEPIIGLDDVAGVEQLVDPEVDRLLGSASITKRAKWWLFGMDRDEK